MLQDSSCPVAIRHDSFQTVFAVFCNCAVASFPARRCYDAASVIGKDPIQNDTAVPATGSSKGKCPGYVIDHVVSLACGGADAPENMQWQSVSDAKEKDKWERKGCRRP